MKQDTYTKFDDIGWHSGDASNPTQAGIHIALVYVWLVKSGHISDIPDEWKAKITQEIMTPGEFFEEWSDGKLVSEGMEEQVLAFLKQFYSKSYLLDVGNRKIRGLQYDPRFKSPYDIRDSWQNAQVVQKYLDEQFATWQSRQG